MKSIKFQLTWLHVGLLFIFLIIGALWYLSNLPTKVFYDDIPKWKQTVYTLRNDTSNWLEENITLRPYKWEKTGNTYVNQSNNSVTAENGKWKVIMDNGTLYRIKNGKSDGTRKMIGRNHGNEINITKKGIIMNEGNQLIQLSMDGKEKKVLTDDLVMYVRTIGENVYYTKIDDNNEHNFLVRFNLENGQKETIVKETIFTPVVTDQHIYYVKAQWDGTDNGIFRVDLGGQNRTKLTDMDAFRLQIAGDFIYFLNSEGSEGKVYRIPLKGGKEELLVDDKVKAFLVTDDNKIYYSTWFNAKNIGFYQLNLANQQTIQLSDLVFVNFSVLDDTLYMNRAYHSQLVKMDMKTNQLGNQREVISPFQINIPLLVN